MWRGYQVEAFCDKDPSKQATSAGSEVVKRNKLSELGLAYPDIFLGMLLFGLMLL